MWSEGVEVEEGVTWVWGGLGWQRKDKGGCHSAPQPLPSQSPALQAHSLIMPVESGSSTCCSVAKSCVTLWPHGLQRSRLPCPSLSPGVCSNSCPLSWWCHPTISSSVTSVFCPQSFPASGSFPVSWLFTSGDQSIGASALASVHPMNIQGRFPLELTGLGTMYTMLYLRWIINKDLLQRTLLNAIQQP